MSSVYQVMVLLGYINSINCYIVWVAVNLCGEGYYWHLMRFATFPSRHKAPMDGNNKSAPASSNTCLSSGPVLTATVNMPAAVPACTPIGAFSTTIASLAWPRLFQSH